MRRIIIVGATIALVFVGVISIRTSHSPSSPAVRLSGEGANRAAPPSLGSLPAATGVPARNDLDGQPAMSPPEPGELSTQERSPLADALGAPGTRPEAEVEIVLEVLQAYRRAFKEYPAGEENRQFVNALRGANKEKLPFLPSDHPRLTPAGELVDAQGTPFFFHLLSRTAIEVRSAGPDRMLFTEDDFVAGPPTALPIHSEIVEDPPLAE